MSANFIPLSVETAKPQPPRGWRWALLTDLARLESGHTPSRYRPDWWGGDIPWLALPDIRNLDGKVAFDTTERTNQAGLDNSSARLLPKDTVCLSRTASVGYVAILGRPMATSQDFVNWVCGPDLDPLFLLHLLRASRDYLRSLSSGAIHKTIYVPTVKAFNVCVPALAEQKRIAAVLNDQMAAAEQLCKVHESSAAEIRALNEAILRNVFRSDEANRAPTRTLRALCVADGQYGSSEKADGSEHGVPMLRMGDITDGAIDWSSVVYASLSDSDRRKYRLSPGDLLFNRTNSAELVGKTAVFEGDREAAFASYLIRFRLDPAQADPYFVSTYINSRYGREFISRHMTRAIGQVNISASTMHQIPIPALPVERQRALSARLVEGKRILTHARNAAYVQRRAMGLLPAAFLRQAFSGEL